MTRKLTKWEKFHRRVLNQKEKENVNIKPVVLKLFEKISEDENLTSHFSKWSFYIGNDCEKYRGASMVFEPDVKITMNLRHARLQITQKSTKWINYYRNEDLYNDETIMEVIHKIKTNLINNKNAQSSENIQQ